jgi:EmrB/QacA subfamily drug resistance transporter
MAAQHDPPAEAGLDPELRRLAVVVVLGAIMTILDTTIVNVAVDTLGRDFHTSLATIQWVLTAYTLALAMTIPITGWAVRRYGGRTMWVTSLVLFIAGSVLCGAAWSVGSLIAFRVLQAVGGGMLMPVGQTMLARRAGPRRMGRMMSVIAVPAMVGPVLGPVLGGLIVDHLAWRWMFYINVPFCALALVAAFVWLPADDAERVRDARLDVLGLVLLSPGLAALVYGLAQAGGGHEITDPRVYGWVGAGAVLTAAFAAHALRRRERALVDLAMFRDRGFTTSVGALFVYTGAMFGVMFESPVYFQAVRGDSPLRAGLLLAPMGLGAMVTMPVAGRLADRAGARPPALAGLVLVLSGLVCFTRIDAGTDEPLLALAGFVIGLGHGTMMPALLAAAYQRLDRAAVPAATTASNVLIRVGGSFGVAALAVALQVSIRHAFPSADGSVASVASVAADRTPDALSRLAHAFGHGFWWALGITAVAFVPIALLPGRARTGSVVQGDGAVAEPVDDPV